YMSGMARGIYLADPDARAIGNIIDSPTQYGIYVRDTAPRSMVAQNTVIGGTRGIYNDGTTADGIQIVNNVVSGSTTDNVTVINTKTWRGQNVGAARPTVAAATGTDAAAINALAAALRNAGIIA